MDAAGIQARAVVKLVAISLAVIAVAVLLAIVVLHVRTEIRWVFAALFLALAMLPAVDRAESLRIRGRKVLPRWLAIRASRTRPFSPSWPPVWPMAAALTMSSPVWISSRS